MHETFFSVISVHGFECKTECKQDDTADLVDNRYPYMCEVDQNKSYLAVSPERLCPYHFGNVLAGKCPDDSPGKF